MRPKTVPHAFSSPRDGSQPNCEANLIYDVGAHKGEDTDFYLKKGFSVVAIEADPKLTEIIKTRFPGEIDSGRLILISAAIACTAGTVQFYANRHKSVWGTIERKFAERNRLLGASGEMLEVKAVTFDSVLTNHGIPYYLKVDIEGAERLCLEALEKFSGRSNYISIESERFCWKDLCYEFELLQSLGYDRFKVIDQATVPQQSPPQHALEGNAGDHKFSPGSSGLFGDELPGAWLTATQAMKAYRRIFLRYWLFGDNTIGEKMLRKTGRLKRLLPSWYDTHARHQTSSMT